MKLVLEMEMDNAAFHENANGYEASRILHAIAHRVQGVELTPGMEGNFRDINGNKVCTWKVVDE